MLTRMGVVADVVLVGLKNRCKERPENKLSIPVGQRRTRKGQELKVTNIITTLNHLMIE